MNAIPEPVPKLGLAELNPTELPNLEIVVRNAKSEIIANIGAQICALIVSPTNRVLYLEAVSTSDEAEPPLLERGRLVMDSARHKVLWDGKEVSLTVTEFLILEALAQRPGVVKTRNQLLDTAYSDDVYVDDRTIDSHIKRIRRKFRVADPDFDAVETLYGVGYRFDEQ